MTANKKTDEPGSYTSMLDKNQTHAMNLYNAGFNLFVTGSAGTGKSLLIKSMKESYILKYKTSAGLYITSTTGLSSINIEGITIHSWSGITPHININDPEAFLDVISKNYKIYNKYLYTKTLIIDEVSMLSYKFLDFLNGILQTVRKNTEAFGGIQIILVGDYYQLPPVNKFSTDTLFSFKAACWDEIIDYSIILKTIHRQDDRELIEFLNKLRQGIYDESVLTMLETFSNNKNYNPNYTHLYPNKLHVNAYNLQRLYSIKGDIIEEDATMIYKTRGEYPFPKDTIIMEKLLLKKGAFVIINKNVDPDNNLVNGTQGIFMGFNQFKQAIVETHDGRRHYITKQKWEYPSYFIEQYPLCLAWALTIHKSQGMGIKYLSVDIGDRIFSDGQMYVALSRATDPEFLHIKHYSLQSIRSNKSVKKFYKGLAKKGKIWHKIVINDTDMFQNKLNGKIRRTIPTHGIIEASKFKDLETSVQYSGIFSKNTNMEFTCKICRLNEIEQSYASLFDTNICMACIIKDDYYKLLNKKDIKDSFNLNNPECKEVTRKCLFKSQPNFRNCRFPPTRLYLQGHIRDNLNKKYPLVDDELNNSKIGKYFKQPYTDSNTTKGAKDKTLPPPLINTPIDNIFKQNTQNELSSGKTTVKMTIHERMTTTFNLYFIDKKTLHEIKSALGDKYSIRTIENYIYKCFISDDYNFIEEYLVYLGYDENLKNTLRSVVEIWRRDAQETVKDPLDELKKETGKTPEAYPRLRYIKDNIDKKYNYLLIKMCLYEIYKYVV